MEIYVKPDPEIRRKIKELHKDDRFYIGSHEVHVNLGDSSAMISISQGSLIWLGNSIRVARNPFTFFGLITVKPFEERIQNAVNKKQCECDNLDAMEIENIEIEIKVV